MANYVKDSTWKDETTRTYGEDSDVDSETVRSEIDATRQRLGNHLDKLQERLQPENLVNQTQHAVENALTDSMDTVKEYVNDYVQQVDWVDVRDTVLDTVRRNPVPTALIGVGLGWMLLGGSKSRTNGRRNVRRGSDQDFEHGLGWREETPEMESPTAAAMRHAGKTPGSYAPQVNPAQRRSVGDSYTNRPATNRTGNGWQTEDDSIVDQVKDGISDAASQVQKSASKVANSLYGQAANVGSQLQESAGEVAENASEWAEQWQGTGEAVSQWSHDTAESLGNYTQRTLDENPLMFGAVALAVGAGLGMLLPATRYEEEVFGEYRKQAVEKVQDVVEEVKDRAQTVINELQPDIEKTASNVVKNVEDVGKQAVGEVRQSIQKATEKLDEKTDSSAKI